MTNLSAELPDLRRLQLTCLSIGIIAMAACLVELFFNRQQFFQSYLMAYIFWVGIPVGCFGLVMIHHLVGGTWGFVIQRPLEAAIRTFPVMAVLFLPIFFGLSDLYPWARPEVVAHDPVLKHKAPYLNVAFFSGRAVLYFAIWISVSYFLIKWSRDQERTGDNSFIERIQTLSGPGLVLYGSTVTFSVIDWIMSLEPHWSSTIYGMIFMVSHGLVALTFIVIVVFFLTRQEPLADVMAPWIFQDLGNLMLALIMLWAYTSFSQFLLVWVENLNHEIPWYLHRIFGGWRTMAISLVGLQFALPFLLLLSRMVKRSQGLFAVALLIAFMHLVEMFWFVAPAFHSSNFSISWTDVLAPIGLGALWIAAFLWQLPGRPLLPFRDPRFVAIVHKHELVKNG